VGLPKSIVRTRASRSAVARAHTHQCQLKPCHRTCRDGVAGRHVGWWLAQRRLHMKSVMMELEGTVARVSQAISPADRRVGFGWWRRCKT
jgi:hypothetical protein